METHMKNGIKVMVLNETHKDERGRDSDAMTMFRLWTLLSGETALRDHTPGGRNIR